MKIDKEGIALYLLCSVFIATTLVISIKDHTSIIILMAIWGSTAGPYFCLDHKKEE